MRTAIDWALAAAVVTLGAAGLGVLAGLFAAIAISVCDGILKLIA